MATFSQLHRPRVHTALPRVSAFGPTAYTPTTAFEVAFRNRLAEMADGAQRDGVPKRTEITTISTALRGAVDPDQVLRVARGLTAESLWHAYRYVERLRSDAHRSFDSFLADPTPARLSRDAHQIRLLLPGPIGQLEDLALRRPERLAAAVSDLAGEIRRLDRSVEEIESRLDAVGSPTLAASLDDGCQGGAFHQPEFRPRRVGALMPSRLAVLLGESQNEEGR